MKKYGEISRFNCGNYLFILISEKANTTNLIGTELYIPFLSFSRSRKSAKKRFKNIPINDAQYILEDKTFNLKLINKLIQSFGLYLNTIKPKYISMCPHHDKYKKRLKLYKRILLKYNYSFIGKHMFDMNEEIYYFKRIENEISE